ncbi:auxin efflux family transporter [Yoonia sediminilitoris]|uniref:Auxin efflux family transporter n=1 Tax=Yoonia sediminilitoris TaxID=1286148 RepID=A0A2T6KPE0_9RHOB|nr:auxin efflux family transporter [Yoonia sediminilitoris]RCW98604.1 auxin efflux family transporter [Yoonia sediminilitoris]
MLGGIFLWQGWQTPVFLTNTLDLIGQIAIPIMLITLGVAVARLETKALGQAFVLSVIKLAICFAIGWGTAMWFDLDKVASAVLILQVTTPVAVTSYLLAEKYGSDARPVAGLVVASTLLSIVAIPVILAFVM